MQQWLIWINEIADVNQIAGLRNNFSQKGRILKPKIKVIGMPNITDISAVSGCMVFLANKLDEASKRAKKCSILNVQNTIALIGETAAP